MPSKAIKTVTGAIFPVESLPIRLITLVCLKMDAQRAIMLHHVGRND
jgi:hypothetical protein